MKKNKLLTGIVLMALMFIFSAGEALAYEVTLKLQTSDGTPLENGNARYKTGNTVLYFGNPHYTDANGEVSMDIPAGTYSFQMYAFY